MSENTIRLTVYLVSPDRAHPHYGLQWIDPTTGNRRTRTSGTALEAEARKRAAVLEERLNAGEVAPCGTPPLSWPDFRSRYEAQRLSGLAHRTRILAKIALNKLEAACSPVTLAGVGESQVAALRRGMEVAGLAPRTVAGNLALVRAALRWAAAPPRRWIAAAPYFEPVAVPDPGPPTRVLSGEGYADLRTRLPDRWRRFLDVGWYTAMRRGEILRLRWEETDLHPHLDPACRRVWFPPGTSKNRRTQCVPVHPALVPLLGPPRKEGRVCDDLPNDGTAASRRFREACAAVGYVAQPHDVRRSSLSFLSRTLSVTDLMRIARHASPNTTRRYISVEASLDEIVLRGFGPVDPGPKLNTQPNGKRKTPRKD